MAMPGHHTLSVLVENKPGVLSRVSGLFSRRGFNIDSLAVGPTERADRSVITIRVDCTRHSVEQVVKQLDKLIDVIDVLKVHPDMAIERELLLIKVKADATHRLEIMRMAEVFNAYIADPSQIGREATRRVPNCGLYRAAGDYIAGMTDRYLLREHARLFHGA
jgi:acetolactate synthase-1/3 small subunit